MWCHATESCRWNCWSHDFNVTKGMGKLLRNKDSYECTDKTRQTNWFYLTKITQIHLYINNTITKLTGNGQETHTLAIAAIVDKLHCVLYLISVLGQQSLCLKLFASSFIAFLRLLFVNLAHVERLSKTLKRLMIV